MGCTKVRSIRGIGLYTKAHVKISVVGVTPLKPNKLPDCVLFFSSFQCIVPDHKVVGSFNTNHFAVRIMSSDFQNVSG